MTSDQTLFTLFPFPEKLLRHVRVTCSRQKAIVGKCVYVSMTTLSMYGKGTQQTRAFTVLAKIEKT